MFKTRRFYCALFFTALGGSMSIEANTTPDSLNNIRLASVDEKYDLERFESAGVEDGLENYADKQEYYEDEISEIGEEEQISLDCENDTADGLDPDVEKDGNFARNTKLLKSHSAPKSKATSESYGIVSSLESGIRTAVSETYSALKFGVTKAIPGTYSKVKSFVSNHTDLCIGAASGLCLASSTLNPLGMCGFLYLGTKHPTAAKCAVKVLPTLSLIYNGYTGSGMLAAGLSATGHDFLSGFLASAVLNGSIYYTNGSGANMPNGAASGAAGANGTDASAANMASNTAASGDGLGLVVKGGINKVGNAIQQVKNFAASARNFVVGAGEIANEFQKDGMSVQLAWKMTQRTLGLVTGNSPQDYDFRRYAILPVATGLLASVALANTSPFALTATAIGAQLASGSYAVSPYITGALLVLAFMSPTTALTTAGAALLSQIFSTGNSVATGAASSAAAENTVPDTDSSLGGYLGKLSSFLGF